MVRQKLVEVVETLDFESVRLRELFSFTLDQTIGFLVNAGALKNEAYCNKCRSKMDIQKRKKNHDGIWWICRNGKKANCSTKSIRTGSFFENSNLTLPTSLLLLYMWATDFDNKHVVRELDLSPKTVVDWLNMCREICQK
jgi:hypothetical protein